MSDQSLSAAGPSAPAPVTDSFAVPDDFGAIRSSEVQTSLGEELGAEAGQAFMGGIKSLTHGLQYLGMAHPALSMAASDAAAAEAGLPAQSDLAVAQMAQAPDVPIADANAQVKQAGLGAFVKLPQQDTIKQPVLDLMLNDARERAQYAATVNRGPQGSWPDALGYATQIGAGMIDPLNAAAFSIPVLGEARFGKLLASAGESILGRAAIKTGVGAAQGALGAAVLAPADWWLHTQDGQDYTMADALKSVVLSAGMGAGFHAVAGIAGDLFNRALGRPLAGTLADLRARAVAGDVRAAEIVEQLGNSGTHLPEAALTPEGAPLDSDDVPGIGGATQAVEPPDVLPDIDLPISEPAPVEPLGPAFGEPHPWLHPAEVLADLPERAREDVTRAAIASVIDGSPVRVGEMLNEAAKVDPRIAESVEAPEIPGKLRMPGGRGPRARPEESWSLLEFLASRGGIDPQDPLIGDVRGSIGRSNKFIPGFGHIIRENGMDLDHAREAAVEAGYLFDQGEHSAGPRRSTISDLLEAMDSELRGKRVYRYDRTPDHVLREQNERVIEENRRYADEALDTAMREIGEDSARLPDDTRERVLEIMTREGVDEPIAALERAFMEEHYGGAETGDVEPVSEKIPGWDDDDDGGSASGGGSAPEGAEGPPGGEAGGGARAGGAADRPAQRLAGADWQSLARRPGLDEAAPAPADADAAKAPAPPAAEPPAKTVSRAQAAASEAEKLLADILPMLSEDERKTFEDALANLKNDEEARAQIVRDGAACLAAAAGAAA